MRYFILMSLFCVGGCGLMQTMGLADETGAPTPEAREAMTFLPFGVGFAITRIWDLCQKRGLDNAKNILNPNTGFVDSVWSVAAWLLGWHSPEKAKEVGDG